MSGGPLFTRIRLDDAAPCPCGGAARGQGRGRGRGAGRGRLDGEDVPRYGDCCAPLHRRERLSETAVELMASRYSAYAAHEADYIWMTWHPRRRPEAVTFDPDVEWSGLEILDVVDGAAGDREGVVEFRARYRDAGGPGELWERSTFILRSKRWMYVDGEFK